MRTKSTLKEVGKLIKSCKYIFLFQKNNQNEFFTKTRLKSSLILILSLTFYCSTVIAQEIPVRVGNTLPGGKVTSKTTSKTAEVSALAAVAGSIDVANPSAGYNSYTADQLVRNVLTSGCLTISNVRFGYYKRNNNNTWTWNNHVWSSTAGNRQLGYYSKGTSTFPIDEGLLLSTGKISSAMGPNTYTNRSDEMVDDASDPDLTTISGRTMHDASILEFDFVPDGNLVEFKFVFASEEYLEYVHTNYNDAFGFFLSGFGITGAYTNNAINLAQLPNGDAVTINNIHSAGTNVDGNSFPNHNVAYYSNNPSGSATMEFDGSTVVLTATYAVTPGKNYKIKMAIADASDQKWDAGVFLKAKSFATNTLVITNPAPICANGTTNITLPAITAGSTAGLTYSYWKDAAATIPYTTPTAATAGTYYIKGLNSQSGCYDIKPVVVSQTTIVITETTASHIDVKCKGTSTGSAVVTASGGTAPYTYSWNTTPVQTTATSSNLAAGTYTVTVTDSKGCSNTKQVVITEPSAVLSATTSQSNITCFGGATGSAAVTVSGGTGAYTYSWNTSPVQTTATASNLTVGTYIVTIKDANLCTLTKTFTITQPTAALVLGVSSKTDISCFGANTGNVTAGTVTNAVGTVTYSWKNASNLSVGNSASVSNLPAGTYTLTVTDSCSSQSNSVTIMQPSAALALGTSSKTNISCFGASTGTVTAGTVTNAMGTVTYSWKNASNVSVGNTASVSNLPAGTYTLTVSDNCSSQTNLVTITQPTAALALGTSSKTDVSCFGASTGTVTAGAVTNAVGTVTYSWKNASNVSVGNTASVSNLPAGTYTLTVSDNCSTQTNLVTITQPTAALALGTSSKTDVSCFGASTGTVTAGAVTNAVGTVTYSWKNASNVSVGNTASVSNLPAGTYTLTVSDNCSSQTNLVTISQPTAALALGTSSKTDVSCFGASTGTVTAGIVTNAVGTVTYSWKNASNVSVGNSASVSNLPAGTYTLTVTDSCSSQTNLVTITQPTAALALGTSSKTDVFCFGANTGTVTAGTVTNAVGTVTYSWKNASNVSVGNTASVSNLPAGTYTLTVSDNCSTQTNLVTITQPTAALALGTSSKTDVSCFGANTGTVTAGTVTNAVGTVTYSWKNASNVSVGNTASVSNLPAGTYTLTVSDNCSSQTNLVTISQPNTALSCSITQNKAVTANGLSNGEATVTPIGGTANYTYLWDNNETTQKAIALNAGLHTVTVTDSKGCTTTCSITITQPNVLSCSITQESAVKCYGGNTGKATVTAIGGNGDYTYLWDNNEITPQAATLTAGLHTVTVTDKLGYTTTCSVTIGQPQQALSATTTQIDVVCGGKATGSATVIVSGGTSPYTYSWNTIPVQTSATANSLTAGTYTVFVTDSNSCTMTKSVTILDGDSINPVVNPLPETSTINCPAEPVFATATATDNNGTITSLTYEDTITPGNCTGSYTKTRTWTAKDPCGNTSLPVSQTIIVQDNTAPTWTTQTGSLNQTIECSNQEALTSAQALFPTASDFCDADVANITKVSGQFIASQVCGNAGTYTNTWTVKDDCGNTSETFTQVITIQDTTSPTWTTQAGSLNQTIECSNQEALTSAQALFPTASDSCDTDVTNITKVSGQFMASQGCGNAGTYTNTWTVKDDCGNTSDTFIQVITIQDTTSPTWSIQAGSLNQTIECSNQEALTSAQALFPTASDSCDTDVTNITKVSGQFVASQSCGNAGTYTNTWTVKDDCGNTSDTFTQVITIQDTTSPTWSTQAGSLNQTIECSNQEALTSAQALFPTASDSCDADVANITKVNGQFVASQSCGNAGTYTNTWTVKDDCGNTSDTFTQVITIQ
ncbi:F0F1-type ATP synthase beta subunit, partial [Flavobacterium sp. HSC-32F16]|uniref:choice-of-anchor L domain-containing protein n=1 Tax=Flavobacterium sp. HSC-32F16 TaxID=2910964 RepID=UPI0020A48920